MSVHRDAGLASARISDLARASVIGAKGFGRESTRWRWLLPGMFMAAAILYGLGELYISSDRMTIAALGRHRTWQFRIRQARLFVGAIVGVLLANLIGGGVAVAIGALLGRSDLALGLYNALAGWFAFVLLLVSGGSAVLLARGSEAHHTRARPLGVYWEVTHLATIHDRGVVAFHLALELMTRAVPAGEPIVAIPRTEALRRIYINRGFRPLSGSYWVLVLYLPAEPAGEATPAERRVRRIADELAGLMGVAAFTTSISDAFGDSRHGAAYTTPATRDITMTETTASMADDELKAILGHELGHLVVAEPRRMRYRLGIRASIALIGCAVGAVGGVLISGSASPLWATVASTALFGLLAGLLVEGLLYAKRMRKLELACDIEKAHAIGVTGLSVFRHDPMLDASWIDQLLATHPSTKERVTTTISHALYARCSCRAGG